MAAHRVAIGRSLRLTLVSAENLKDVRLLGRMKVYANVSLDELPETVIRSDPDRDGQTNPSWDFSVEYQLSNDVLESQAQIVVELKCERRLGADRYVGRVGIGLGELFQLGMSSEDVVTYPVEDCPNGRLHVRYSFSEPCSFIVPIQHVEPEKSVMWTVTALLINRAFNVLGVPIRI